MVTYMCISKPARPPLKLKMLMFPNPPKDLTAIEQIHFPPFNQITKLSPKTRSTISWTFPFSENLRSKTLQCHSVDDGYRKMLVVRSMIGGQQRKH